MYTITKTTIHRLTTEFVEIDSEQYVEINGQQIKLDVPKHSVSYINSVSGRERLLYDQPVNIIKAVLLIWGDEPTIEEEEIPETDDQEEEINPET